MGGLIGRLLLPPFFSFILASPSNPTQPPFPPPSLRFSSETAPWCPPMP